MLAKELEQILLKVVYRRLCTSSPLDSSLPSIFRDCFRQVKEGGKRRELNVLEEQPSHHGFLNGDRLRLQSRVVEEEPGVVCPLNCEQRNRPRRRAKLSKGLI